MIFLERCCGESWNAAAPFQGGNRMGDYPRFEKVRGIDTLIVDGRPFFALAGEIHNSSASDPAYMESHVWPHLEGLNLNTLIVPIYWERIEPSDGCFRFDLLDALLAQARERGMRLILLWFGLWKNAASDYVPEWMKRDTRTYFRAVDAWGRPLDAISPFCDAAVERDAQALAATMAHLREVDGETNTVILVQVENEVGLLGSDRDYGVASEAALQAEVPAVVAQAYGASGTWQEAFGEEAAEHLTAHAFASAVEQIASRAKAAYNLPCFANAWLRQYPWYAGSYPSGGPVNTMLKMWKTAAPSLSALAPDIYVPYVAQVVDEYAFEGNPLIVPEVRKDAVSASYALYAFGHANAACWSPFGIEDLGLSPDAIDKPPAELMVSLNIDPSAFDIVGSREALSRTYELIGHLRPLLIQHRGTPRLQAFVKRSETDFGTLLKFSRYDIQVAYAPKQPSKPLGAGMIFELDEDTFLLVGCMCGITVRAKPGSREKVSLLRLEEGDVVHGEWRPGRVLNGDERMMLRLKELPECRMVKVHSF